MEKSSVHDSMYNMLFMLKIVLYMLTDMYASHVFMTSGGEDFHLGSEARLDPWP